MQRKILTLILLTIVTVMGLFAFDMRLKTTVYRVRSEKLESSVKIALITDLHSCKYGEGESELIAAINEQKPDLILFAGDIFDDKLLNHNAEALIAAVKDVYPCFYVTGNHEYRRQDTKQLLAELEDSGVTVLDGTYRTITVRGQTMNLCGISDPEGIGEDAVNRQLKSLQAVQANGYYTILLTHRPESIEQYAKYGFDLVLCGHAHGGQWRVPGLINGLYAPNQGIFPKYAGGQYTVSQTTMLVSRGLAKEKSPIPRIFNRPELVIVELTKEDILT